MDDVPFGVVASTANFFHSMARFFIFLPFSPSISFLLRLLNKRRRNEMRIEEFVGENTREKNWDWIFYVYILYSIDTPPVCFIVAY